jgi:glutathione S-transferase
MHYFDAILNRQPFAAGEVFSMADITVIGGLIFAGLAKLPVPAECTALQARYARMQERPSVKNRVTMSEPTEAKVAANRHRAMNTRQRSPPKLSRLP